MAKNTIKLKKYGDKHLEYVSTAVTILPGCILQLNSTGLVAKHATAGGNVAPVYIATEDDLQGNGIDTAYAVSSRVQVWVAETGEEAYMYLKDGQNVVIGDLLESAGDGTLNKYVADTADSDDAITVYPKQIVGQALEAVDLSASANTANARIKVRIV